MAHRSAKLPRGSPTPPAVGVLPVARHPACRQAGSPPTAVVGETIQIQYPALIVIARPVFAGRGNLTPFGFGRDDYSCEQAPAIAVAFICSPQLHIQ